MNQLISIPDILERAYKMNPDKEALYDGFTRVTYRQLYDEAQVVASGLAQKGNSQRETESWSASPTGMSLFPSILDWPPWVPYLVPCNTRYGSEELVYILENSGAKAVFVTEDFESW